MSKYYDGKKYPKVGNPTERRMIDAIDDHSLAAEVLPAIKEIIKAGGGPQAILTKAGSMAAMKLVESVMSDKAEISLKAAMNILDRVQGKPVERTLSIYADVNQKSDKELDYEINRLLREAGVENVVESLQEPLPPKTYRPKKQRRKPKGMEVTAEEIAVKAQSVESKDDDKS